MIEDKRSNIIQANRLNFEHSSMHLQQKTVLVFGLCLTCLSYALDFTTTIHFFKATGNVIKQVSETTSPRKMMIILLAGS